PAAIFREDRQDDLGKTGGSAGMSQPTLPLSARMRKQVSLFNLNILGRWFVYAGMVGFVAGIGAIIFHILCLYSLHWFLDLMAGYRPLEAAGETSVIAPGTGRLNPWLLPLVHALGGLLSGLLIYTFAPEAEGHGTDSAIQSFHHLRGVIRARVPIIKTLASALTIGSGGSGGREGPIAQIGAGFGSFLAMKLHLPERDRRILLAAGVGAGVGSIFRAPLAGALFAAEILYSDPEFESDVVIPAALSTIVAYSVFSLKFGFGSLFSTPSFSFHSPIELIPYTLLAVIVSLAAGLFVWMFYASHDLFKKLPVFPHLKPMLGGLATGLVALTLLLAFQARQTLDVMAFGYGSLQQVIGNQIPVKILLVLALGKMLTTSLSIGSGGSGGVFGPCMVIGGSVGGLVGWMAHALMPQLVPQPGAFVLVGMAGFFAAAANTPISTVVMVSEMTGNYELLLPSLWVCAIAYLLGRRFSLYRSQVPTRLSSPAHRREFYVDVLEGLKVSDVCPKVALSTIPETSSLDEIIDVFTRSTREFFPVVDQAGDCMGVISLREIRQVMDERDAGLAVIAQDLAVPPPMTLTPDEPVSSAIQKFVSQDVSELPVIDPLRTRRVLAMLARRDLVGAYNRRRLERLQQQLETAG
ncbi:MAG: chloride channel protein, partial [Acidobacteriota bacterium]